MKNGKKQIMGIVLMVSLFSSLLLTGCGKKSTTSENKEDNRLITTTEISMTATENTTARSVVTTANTTAGATSETTQQEPTEIPGFENYILKAEGEEITVSKLKVTDEDGQIVDSVEAAKLTADVEINSQKGGETITLCMAMHDVYTGELNHIETTPFVLKKGTNTLSASIDMEQLSDYSAYTKELRVCLRNDRLEMISDYVTVKSLQVLDVEFDCYISNDTKLVKGIVLIHRHGYGNTLKDLDALKQFCAERDMAIISFIDSTNNPLKNFPDSDLCGNTILQNINKLAQSTGHSELQYAPIITFGHSNSTAFAAKFAAWASDRCFGVIAYKSAYRGQIDHEEIVKANIPMLIITGELDETYGYQGQIECAEDMTAQGGAVIFAQDPGAGHGPNEHKSNTIVFSFIDKAYKAKVPEITEYNGSLITLNQLDVSKGFYGYGSYTKNEKGLYKYSDYQCISNEEYLEKKAEDETFKVQSWLFDQEFAIEWVEFNETGFITLLPYAYQ